MFLFVDWNVDLDHSLACVNCELVFDIWDSRNVTTTVYVSNWFSLYNTIIDCNEGHTNYENSDIFFICNENNPIFVPFVDDACVSSYMLQFVNCTIITDESEIDNSSRTIINDIMDMLDDVTQFESECSDGNYTYDIGYPIYSEDDIINEIEYSNICCRGFRSCAVTSTLRTNLGNILCLGVESCVASSLVWTDDSNSIIAINDDLTTNSEIESKYANIYCVATYACARATMESSNSIYCANKYSCLNAIVSSAKKVVCSASSCNNGVIRDTNEIYILDKQDDVIIYSGGIGTVYAYFKGADAGDSVIYYCNSADTCYISCDKGSCSRETTLLYCYGKCLVKCDEYSNDYSDGEQCVDIKTSLSPSAAPTQAPSNAPTVPPTNTPTRTPTDIPTNAPTIPPTNSPTGMPTGDPTMKPTYQPTDNELLTAQEVSSYFNWVLIVVAVVLIFCVIIGYNDAKFFHKNELFKIGALYAFAFYTNDFLSDVFFLVRLAVLGMSLKITLCFCNLFELFCNIFVLLWSIVVF